MNDPLLKGQINLAMEHPILTLLFVAGALLCVVGLGLFMIGGSERYTRHCMNIAMLGSGIAMPALFPVLGVIGGSENSSNIPGYFVAIAFTVVCTVNGYMIERKWQSG